ncbi:hydrolase or acyltransferase (alpha/beta hydrolase) [Seohaeicola zhoushanensis]|uniref:Hydrolase or acyltransferase (Alpha/beta hydrolase) n=1 Tax=Seohaeicola zhoushanensis TaxID=1569283 RepID=A0A8J3GWA0_9RHOB|nr:hydrolase or acyltransferase (alpha/beta hydrolase) [Seohaeicola zhoushanensis]
MGLGLLLLAGVTHWAAARHETRAEAAFPPEGQLMEIDGVQVHAVVAGQGPDLVLIHGASGSTRDMTFGLAPALADRYRVIAIDRPGLGYTERLNESGATITQQAALLAEAARRLGAERPLVLGHSYGGAVALAWAVNHPDRLAGLVALSAASQVWDGSLPLFYRITSSHLGSALAVPLITAFVPDSVVEKAVAEVFEPQQEPAGYADYFGPALTLRRVSMRANAAQRANLLVEIEALAPQYGEIAVPTEIVHGTADTTVGIHIHSEKLVNQIPGAILTRLPGIGHMPHHVSPEDVIAAIDRVAARAGLR